MNDRPRTWEERLADVLTGHPRRVLGAAVALTLGLLLLLPTVRFDASVERLAAQNDPAADELRVAKRLFGNDDLLIVAQVGDEPVLGPERFGRLRSLSDAIGRLPEVERVWSLATTGHVHGTPDGAEIIDLNDAAAVPATLAAVRDEVARSPIYRGHLLSDDGKTAALLVFPRDRPDDALLRDRLVASVRALVPAYSGPERLIVSGDPAISVDIVEAMRADCVRFSALTAAALAGMLALLFRNRWAVVLPLGAVGLATLTVVVFMTAFGNSISVLTTTVPATLLSIGTTYAVYIFEHYAVTGGSTRLRMRVVLHKVAMPMLVSTVTTVAGFLSLGMTSQIAGIREYGDLGAIGTAVVSLAVLGIVPAGLAAFEPTLRHGSEGVLDTMAHRLLERARRAGLQHPFAVLFGLGIAFAGCGVAAMRLTVDTTYVRFLRDDGHTSRDLAEVTARLAGVVPLYITIDSGVDGGAIEPDVLARVAALQRHLETLPLVSRSLSVVDFLSELNRAVDGEGGDLSVGGAVPASQRLAGGLLLLYESSGYAADLGRFVTPDHRHLNVWVRTNLQSSGDTRRLVAAIRQHLRAHFPAFECHVTGTTYTVFKSANEVAWSQVRSLGLALVTISAIVMLTVRSVRYGLVALPTNLLPLGLLFGVMEPFKCP